MERLEAEVEVVMLLVWLRSDGCEEVVSAREGVEESEVYRELRENGGYLCDYFPMRPQFSCSGAIDTGVGVGAMYR